MQPGVPHAEGEFAPDSALLLRWAIRLRLDDVPDSAAMLIAALKTVSDELIARGFGAEHLVLVLRDAWRDTSRDVLRISASDSAYHALLEQALVIHFAPRDSGDVA